MSSRPRRSAAARATAAITDLADRDANEKRTMSSSSSSSRRPGGAPANKPGVTISSSGADETGGKHIHLTVKVPSSKLRQVTSGSGSAIVAKGAEAYNNSSGGRRAARAGKKSYVVESDSDDEDEEDEDAVGEDEEEEGEDEIQVGSARPAVVDDDDEEDAEGEDEDMDEDAEGAEADDDIMDVDRYQDDNDDEALVGDDGYGEDDEDAEGEDDDDALGDEDADGDIDMDTPAPKPPTIKISRPNNKAGGKAKQQTTPSKKTAGKTKTTAQKSKAAANVVDDDDDDELSELESDPDEMNDTVKVGGEEDAEGEDDDMDAEGEEIEVAEEDALGEDDDGLGSDEDGGSRADTPDVTRMTARQRAKHGDVIQEYMKLSDEVQVKKHFTAEELSMRRAEMARRRRNLSEKRNEEVKMETINKLLKKQAPKTNRRIGHLPGDESPPEFPKPNPVFIRWVSSKKGSIVAVPEEIVEGPVGRVFVPGGLGVGKVVEEVS
ncbi:PAPA-1-like conserved region-domain-containing protein [Coniochaeta sp. 2T2.1]|nr:PAPA-1-like conserved region-domain-containing protein [Coniochaeta sp. 2T2.1]